MLVSFSLQDWSLKSATNVHNYPNVVSAAAVEKKQKYIAVSLVYDASLECDARLNLFFLVSLFPSCLPFVVFWPHLLKIFSPNANTLNL